MLPVYSLWAISASLLASTVSLVLADTGSSHVINLTAESFEASVAEEPLMLVQFSVPWAFRGKILAPHYEEAAAALQEKNIKLAKVACNEEAELCQRHDIRQYPTLKVYKNGTPIDYTGPSKASGMVNYMIKQSLPTVSEVTPANHEEFIKISKIVVVAYLSPSDSESASIFSTVAEDYREYCIFGLSTDPANAEAIKVKPPAIIAYRKFDETRTDFAPPAFDFGVNGIEDWLSELLEPAIDPLDSQNYGGYLNSGKPLAELLLDPASKDNYKLLEALRPIAREFKHLMDFVWVDVNEFSHHGPAVKLPAAKWPAFVINDIQHRSYPIDQSNEITPELVTQWINRFVKGELESPLRSALIPENQDQNVYVVVGKNFDKIVFDDSKDVFIEFYSLWCDYCKRLEPVWDALGDKFAAVREKITIAKMETLRNEFPPSVTFRLRGSPSMKFKPAGSRNFVDYEGDYSLGSLIAFVEEHAKNSLTVFEKSVKKTEGLTVDDEEEDNIVQIPMGAIQL